MVFVLCLADAFSNSISVIFYHVCASGSTPGDIHLLHIYVVFCAFRRLYKVELRVLSLCSVVAFSNSISGILSFAVPLACACGNSISCFLVLVVLEAILYPEFIVVASGFRGFVCFFPQFCTLFLFHGITRSNSISGILYYCFHVLLRLSDRLYRCLCG